MESKFIVGDTTFTGTDYTGYTWFKQDLESTTSYQLSNTNVKSELKGLSLVKQRNWINFANHINKRNAILNYVLDAKLLF